MRDLYELGDLHRPEYVARRDAINAELVALAPQPIPDLDQARMVLEDFTIFWTNEADPAAKRQFLSLIFESVWLDQDRVVAVQPKPSFLPFFEHRRPPQARETAGVRYGSDGGRVRSLPIEASRSGRLLGPWPVPKGRSGLRRPTCRAIGLSGSRRPGQATLPRATTASDPLRFV